MELTYPGTYNHTWDGYTIPTGNITLPSSVTHNEVTYTVTSIDDYVFSSCTSLTGNLVIPNSVTSIGNMAFSSCHGFTELTLGNSVTSIGDYAFMSCDGFTGNLTISNSVTTIGNHAFGYCYGFTGSLTIPNSVTIIGDNAFNSCYGLEQIIVESGNMVYDSRNNCNAIIETSTNELIFGCKNTVIPNDVTTIGNWAFANCMGFIGSLTIPNSVTIIGDHAFDFCIGFTGNLTIGNSVIVIGDHAFTGCSGFTGSLTIPGSVTMIGSSAFEGCSGFTGNLSIGNSVTTIGERAFYQCGGFTGSLTIPNSVTEIGNYAFSGCSGFTGDLTIPNSVTTIGSSAFSSCSGFTGSLTIPNSVTEIGNYAFSGCSGFTGDLTIPNSVTTIGSSAFSSCSGFTGNLIIPNSVTEIGNYAFTGCSGFTGSLTIPSSVTSIGSCAFRYCSGFTGNLTIPNSVTEIGEGAFSYCSGFTGNLTIPGSVTTIGSSTFYGCSGFTGSLIIPNSVTTIGNQAFIGCSGFTGSLTISDTVTTIGSGAFYGCSGFTGNLIIGNSVTTIGSSAFSSCSGFTGNLIIPNSVTEIGNYAFTGCSGFTGNLIIGNSVTTIGNQAFYGCSGFTGSLTIPSLVTTIGISAFNSCSRFSSITVYAGIPPFLELGAFSYTNDCPIYVPYESKEVYIITNNWSNYASRIFPWLQKSISGYGNSAGGWYFIASPVLSSIEPTEVDSLVLETEYDLYRFNQSADAEWENYKNPLHTEGFTINNGKGYLYASMEDVNIMFKGTFNEFDERMISLAYDAGKPFAGWNLVGNPFPVNAYADRSYYIMNTDGSAIEPIAVSSSTAIAPCTGIMVKAEEIGESVSFFKSTRQVENKGLLQIAVAENTRSNPIEDKAVISFNKGDALSKFVFNKNNAQISIPQSGEDYAITCAEKRGEMPLNFKAAKNGSYTLSVNPEAVEMEYLHLIDNLTGNDIDLLVTPSYTFEAKTSDYASRFRLVFSVYEDVDGDNEEPFAFISNGSIIVTGDYVNAMLQIVDLTGRFVISTEVANNVSINGIASGVYVLRLINGENVRTQKIVVNN